MTCIPTNSSKLFITKTNFLVKPNLLRTNKEVKIQKQTISKGYIKQHFSYFFDCVYPIHVYT